MLETRRLSLRPWVEEDAPPCTAMPRTLRWGPSAGWPPHTSEEKQPGDHPGVLSEPETYAVVLKETGEPVGSVGIILPPQGNSAMEPGEAEIGYWIGVPYWGRGLIPGGGGRPCWTGAFYRLDCHTVWCSYFEGNEKSRRVMEKCGFVYHHPVTGEPNPVSGATTTHFTRITRPEWETRQQEWGGQAVLADGLCGRQPGHGLQPPPPEPGQGAAPRNCWSGRRASPCG